MAKQSKIAAEARRRATVERYAARRAALKDAVRRAEPGSTELAEAVQALGRLPRDASPVRLRNRDQVDGRPRGYLRKAGLSRIRFREMAHRGELPGVTKSSW
ncbi:small subunit ribosomal protein S14 [Nocardioides aromaticivorans]|uniref:Small ribosomal subunit protein uS14 n=1 Tax=Nocardioides aromaticivorans TaxID=200618 RepID=A0A7Y9ZH97_9ACTN|nr:30S ribosomal protein S14 [Nocardioides aromaticivorans]NYI45397.1 small subunit ribosomal protein S14 [Nocardioides aromaticivorans]